MTGAVGDHAVAAGMRQMVIDWVFEKTTARAYEDAENEDPERAYVHVWGRYKSFGVRARVEGGVGIIQLINQYQYTGWVVEDKCRHDLSDPDCWKHYAVQMRKWLSR